MQALLKTTTGSGLRHDVVLFHLREFLSQKTGNTWGTPWEQPGNTTRAQNEHLGNTSGLPGESVDQIVINEVVPSVREVAKQQPLFAAETAKKEKTKKPRGEPRPGHLILDAVGRLVGPCLVAQTITLWRKCNATVAHDMAAAGITPEMAARDWQRARDAGRTCVTLFALRSWMQMKNVTPFLAVEGPSEDRGPKFREWPASFIDVFHDKITNKWTFSDEWVKAKGLSSNVAWG